ncbi:MAG: TetR/AcrR family transcriptional regulator [Burkholderiaceae bacterium]
MKKTLSDSEFLHQLTTLLLQEGISSLTVATIAARLHCSRRRLYEFATTKEDLFCKVVQDFFDETLQLAERKVAEAKDRASALRASLEVGAKASAHFSLAFLQDVEASAQAKAIFDRYQEIRSQRICLLIDQGVSEGVFVPCHGQVVSQALLSAAFRLRTPAFLATTGLSLEQAFDELYRVFLGGLLASTDPSR